MIASLIYNTPELISTLRSQVPDIYLIDVSDQPLEGCDLRYESNLLWAQNWHRFLMETKEPYVWMLNSDIEGVSVNMYDKLLRQLHAINGFMITPSFNSPHQLFQHCKKQATFAVNWIDMACPVIDVDKYRKLGGFDPQFKGYFADVDLCYRARLKDFDMLVDYSLKVNHLGSYTVAKTNKWEQAHAGDSELIFNKYGKSWIELCLQDLHQRKTNLFNLR